MSGYLTVHFLAVLAYTFPSKADTKFKFCVFPYIYPYFHQSWSLFVPVPKENFNVYVKFDGAEWEDLFSKIYTAHQRNRLGGNEALMLALSNSLRYYASSVSETSSIEKDDDANVNFIVLKKIIRSYYIDKNKELPKNIQVIIRTKNSNNELDYSHYYKLN